MKLVFFLSLNMKFSVHSQLLGSSGNMMFIHTFDTKKKLFIVSNTVTDPYKYPKLTKNEYVIG